MNSEESGKFGLARHYKDLPTKTVSFQDNLQSAVSHLYTDKKNSQSIFNVKKGGYFKSYSCTRIKEK